MSALAWLQTPSLGRSWAFVDVIASVRGSSGETVLVTIPGKVWSEFPSGPNLLQLATAGAELAWRDGLFPKDSSLLVGLVSCRAAGFRGDDWHCGIPDEFAGQAARPCSCGGHRWNEATPC